jgi:RimJ/RimL family protein N-acetyltransferase
METYALGGHHVTLRPIALADVNDRYVGWLRDPEVNRYLETRFTEQTLATVTDFVKRAMAAKDEHLFAICLDGVHVGNIKVGPVKSRHKLADVSLFVGERAAWGKGVATAAIVLASRHALHELGLRKLHAGIYAPNVGSAKAFARAGFKQEGLRRRHYLLEGESVDVLEFGLCADEIPLLPGAGA